MVDLVHLQVELVDDVMVEQLEVLVVDPVLHVPLPPGEEVVRHDDLVAGQHQAIHQVGADEAGAACCSIFFHEAQ